MNFIVRTNQMRDMGIFLTNESIVKEIVAVFKSDVENAKAGAAAPAPKSSSAPTSSGPDAKQLADMLGMAYTEIPNNNIKKVTARRLTEAKQTIPHFYLSVDCVLDKLLAARVAMNDAADGAYKLSVN